MDSNNIIIAIFQKDLTILLAYVSRSLLPPFLRLLSFYWHIALPYALLLLTVGIAVFLVYTLLRLWLIFRNAQSPHVFLELTPLSNTQKSSFTTAQLFTAIHGLARQRSWLQCVLHVEKNYAFEIVSTKNDGIRYIARLPQDDGEIVKKHLIAYLPGIKITEMKDYLRLQQTNAMQVTELQLTNDFVYPLKKQENLEEYDPIAYITATMTKLMPQEMVAFQVVVSPIDAIPLAEVRRIQTRFAEKKDVIGSLRRRHSGVQIILFILSLCLRIITLPIGIGIFLLTEGRDGPFLPFPSESKGPVQHNAYTDMVEGQIKQKIDQQLFSASLRFVTEVSDTTTRKRIVKGFIAALSPFTNANIQSFQIRKNLRLGIIEKFKAFLFTRRLPSFSGVPILSSSEIADVYHFPFTNTTKTEDLIKSKSRDLPAPLSLKKDTTRLDVVVGKNNYGGEETPVGLTQAQRHEHTYIVGKTGMGKTTIIKQMAYQDILSGKGVAVIDPHGDLVKELLSVIPESRKKDVIYLDPTDKSWPVGLNILNPGGTFVDEEEKADWITGSVISVFMKITSKANWGQRMEHILRNATMTALTTESPTLMTIQKLLTNTAYRSSVTATLKDPVLKQFWTDEFKMFGDMQKADMISPLTNKLGEFITSPLSRHILLQAESTIKFSDVMDEGEVLLVNLSKGSLGEERSGFFGTLIISLIQMAAYQRAQIPENKRKDFFLYIDEFQNFANVHFADIFSEARKFHVFIIPSHQNVAQIEDVKTAKVVLGNSGTIISLKNGPDDEAVILPFMEPEVEKGEIVNLPPHHFFMKVTNEDSEDAFSGETVPLNVEGSDRIRDFVIAKTRKLYATPRAVVEKQLDILFGVNDKPEEKISKKTENEADKSKDTDSKNTEVKGKQKPKNHAHRHSV